MLDCLDGLYKCDACSARKDAKAPVYPVGPLVKNWVMVVGRNPGRDEDNGGEPFIGRAGKFLMDWLGEVGLSREQVYITNCVKCFTENNRPPTDTEIETCSRLWLREEGVALNPRLLIVLGMDAYYGVFGKKAVFWSNLVGKKVETLASRTEILIMPHPSATFYQPDKKVVYKEAIPKVQAILAKIKEEPQSCGL